MKAEDLPTRITLSLPWSVRYRRDPTGRVDSSGMVIEGADGERIATVESTTDETFANLLMAAPKLLAALAPYVAGDSAAAAAVREALDGAA